MRHAVLAILAVAGTVSSAAAQGELYVVESTTRKVMTFNAFDGTPINTSFIDMSVEAGTPIEALLIGSEVWVSNQLNDGIARYDAGTGAFLGSIVGGMDNVRGIEVVGNTLYVTNAGTNNGAPGDAVVTIDIPTQSITGFWRVGPLADGDPFDVLHHNGRLLVNDISGENLEFHDLAGNWQSTLHDSDGITGIDFPEQHAATAAGTYLAAGFSPPIGIYEYDSTGLEINYWPVGNGNRGVAELGNGDILFTSGSGVFVLERATGNTFPMFTGVSGRFISLAGPPVCRPDLSGSTDPNDPNYGVPDGLVDASDFFYFLDQFAGGNLAVADLSGSTDPNDPGYGVPDGSLDASDFFYFLDIFVAGCP
mgnify:CR=1 FL=1